MTGETRSAKSLLLPHRAGEAIRSHVATRRFWLWTLKGPVAVLVLWVFAYQVFQTPPQGGHYRIDRREAVAYPMSDALSHFVGGLAILSGDGWVNWREDSRYTVDKPGWTASLACLTYLCRGDTERIQCVLSILLAAVGPATYLLVTKMYCGARARIVGFLTAILFVLYPSDRSWVYMNAMMTEGPALLLSLLVCAFAVHALSRRRWRLGEALFLGLISAFASLVRGQARYAVAAIVFVALVTSVRGLRARLPFITLLLTGFLCLAGPFYLKTSYHLGHPYMGTSYTSLRAVLEYSEIGRSVGGAKLDPEQAATEFQSIQALSERAHKALRANFAHPRKVWDTALLALHHSFFENLSKAVGTYPKNKRFLISMWILTAIGLSFSLARVGMAALVPLVYAVAYLTPNILFSYYWRRFGVPVSWLGMVYVAGVAILAIQPERLIRRAKILAGYVCQPSKAARLFGYALGGGPPRQWPAPWPRWWICAGICIWVLGCSVCLVLADLAPLPRTDVRALLSDRRTQEVLQRAGVTVDDALRDEMQRAFTEPQPSVRRGTAFLPFVMQPGDEVFKYPWNERGLPPRPETYTAVYVFSPWKSPGGFQKAQYSVKGRLYPDFRNGDEVLVLLSKDRKSPYVKAILPTRWAKEAKEQSWNRTSN